MTNSKPNVDPDGYYNVKETAEALQIDRHTVAKYAEEGLIRFRIRKAGKRKVTTGAQIIKCWQSMYL